MSAPKQKYLTRFRRAAFARRSSAGRYAGSERTRSLSPSSSTYSSSPSATTALVPHEVFLASLSSRIVPINSLSRDDRTCNICLDPLQHSPSAPKQRLGLACLERRLTRPTSSSSTHSYESPLYRASSITASPTRDTRPVVIPCGHVFGKDCLEQWLKLSNKCPLCRRDMCWREDGYRISVGYLDDLERRDVRMELVEYAGIESVDTARGMESGPDFGELCDYLWMRLI